MQQFHAHIINDHNHHPMTNQSIHAIHHRAVQTVDVDYHRLVTQFVHAFQAIVEVHQFVNQNVLIARNVLKIKLALI
jgi:hypothetical protein